MSRAVYALTLSLALTVAGPISAFGFSGGVTTVSFPTPATGCNNVICHSGGTTPIVTLTGPTELEPGETGEYLLTILSVGAQTQGGFNVSAASGMLMTGGSESAMTQVLSGQVTHAGRKPEVAGEIRFSFEWEAPGAEGDVTLSGWGNAVNANFTAGGDAAALAELVVTVESTAPAVPAMPSPAGPIAMAVLLLAAGLWWIRPVRVPNERR